MWWAIPAGLEMLGQMQQADAQQAQANAQATQLEQQGKADSLAIDRELNDALENQAITGAMQGRTGGTLQVIADDSQRRANVDKSLLSLNTDIQATSLRMYGRQAKNAGIIKAVGGFGAVASKVQGY